MYVREILYMEKSVNNCTWFTGLENIEGKNHKIPPSCGKPSPSEIYRAHLVLANNRVRENVLAFSIL